MSDRKEIADVLAPILEEIEHHADLREKVNSALAALPDGCPLHVADRAITAALVEWLRSRREAK